MSDRKQQFSFQSYRKNLPRIQKRTGLEDKQPCIRLISASTIIPERGPNSFHLEQLTASHLNRDNDILIFDEPTAVLIPQEIEELMKIIRGLTKEGKSVLFISHKLRLTRMYLLERQAGIPPKCRSSKICCNRCLESRAAPSIPWRKAVPWLPLSEMEHNMLYLIIAALSSSAKVSVQLEVFSTLSARCDAWLFYDYEPAFYKAQHRL